MDEPGIERITSFDGVERCETLFREHMTWVIEQTRLVYGLEIAGSDPEQAHRSFLEELPNLLGPRGRILIASLGGADAGVGVLKPISDEVAEIKRMYVRPEARGRGVARRLVEELLDGAREGSYSLVRLDSASYMTAAHALYRSVGFRDCPPYPDFEGARYAPIETSTWTFMSLLLGTPGEGRRIG